MRKSWKNFPLILNHRMFWIYFGLRWLNSTRSRGTRRSDQELYMGSPPPSIPLTVFADSASWVNVNWSHLSLFPYLSRVFSGPRCASTACLDLCPSKFATGTAVFLGKLRQVALLISFEGIPSTVSEWIGRFSRSRAQVNFEWRRSNHHS